MKGENQVVDCYMGEPHAGERRNMEVAAGPQAKQGSVAMR
jgi:hypothetical protein